MTRRIHVLDTVKSCVRLSYMFYYHWPSSAQQTLLYFLIVPKALSFQLFPSKEKGEVNQLLASASGLVYFLHVPLPPLYEIDEDSRVYVYEHNAGFGKTECYISVSVHHSSVTDWLPQAEFTLFAHTHTFVHVHSYKACGSHHFFSPSSLLFPVPILFPKIIVADM